MSVRIYLPGDTVMVREDYKVIELRRHSFGDPVFTVEPNAKAIEIPIATITNRQIIVNYIIDTVKTNLRANILDSNGMPIVYDGSNADAYLSSFNTEESESQFPILCKSLLQVVLDLPIFIDFGDCLAFMLVMVLVMSLFTI